MNVNIGHIVYMNIVFITIFRNNYPTSILTMSSIWYQNVFIVISPRLMGPAQFHLISYLQFGMVVGPRPALVNFSFFNPNSFVIKFINLFTEFIIFLFTSTERYVDNVSE